jgi:hypothetical protein
MRHFSLPMKLLMCAVWLAPMATAEWHRFVTMRKGSWEDTPAPQPLSYFTRYPSLRIEEDKVLGTPEQRLAAAKKVKARTELHLIGNINGFPVYDLFSYVESPYSSNGGSPDWKSILVKTGPDRYREIYHDEPNEGKVMPSFLRQLGGETVLGAFDNQYRMDAAEEFWCFSMGVPIRLNLEPLWQAAMKATPADQYTLAGSPFARVIHSDSVSVNTFQNCNMPRCASRGRVHVKFKMQQCSLRVVSSEFEPQE